MRNGGVLVAPARDLPGWGLRAREVKELMRTNMNVHGAHEPSVIRDKNCPGMDIGSGACAVPCPYRVR
ncbi:hypothetical protein ACFV8T_26560 [Streptomyces sp. NPDC059832]|uniref:hypothetical protein n=1 Tax=unclassified Streptomyces TaxID=2593676 RepID=UPI003663ECC8